MNDQTVIIGMGALGLLFGQRMQENMPEGSVCFLMDEARRQRHAGDQYSINSEPVRFNMVTPEELRTAGAQAPALAIVATKYSGLYAARDLLCGCIGTDTTVISLLNGISSEEILAERIPREQIIDCIAIGMDAMRDGTSLIYSKMGRLQIGATEKEQATRLAWLDRFLTDAGVPHEVCPDISKAMWNKFMINVGVNQACMVHETTYGGVVTPGAANEDMLGAMHEVMDIARCAGITLTQEDLEADVNIMRSLSPDGYPSMRQDALAKRPSEVELFAGTVNRLGEKYGVPTPVNTRFYQTIKEIESRYK